jgi:branched-chain amino acid transport system substrate-binding protein
MLQKIKSVTQLTSVLMLVILTGFISPLIPASDNPEFDIALKLYENLQFEEALKKFEKLASTADDTQKELSSIFCAKSLIKLNRFDKAAEYLDKFLKTNQKLKYADEARLTCAQALINLKDYKKAFIELLLLNEKTNDNYYKDYSGKSLLKVGEALLGSADFESLFPGIVPEKQKSLVKLLLGKAYLNEHKYDEARNEFLEILQQYPASAEREEANTLYIKSIELNRGGEGTEAPASVIGVILPLSGGQGAAAAKEILEGIKYAIAEFNKDRNDKIGLVIKDTEQKTENISRIKTEFASLPELKAIIGPVYSGEVREALKEFKDQKIVIISPTATDNDLTQNSDNFFQANPNFTVRGKVMAQYIYYVENKRRMAVLNALEGYGPILASSFTAEFEKLGGKVLIKETYKSGSFSLETPVSKIFASASQVEGIYIPLSDKIDAPVILSQLELKRINLPLYGDQDWLYARGLETSAELSNQLTFTSDYYIDYNSFEFTEFNDAFFKQTKTEVNRNVLYGYDTAKYLLTVLRNFAGSPSAVKQKMVSDMTVNGFHNNICFDEMRINKFLNIVRYRDGIFDLVDEFKLN